MSVSVACSFVISAAHQLERYPGNCARLHGHSYKVEVEVEGPIQPVGPFAGMIIDFRELKEVVWKELEFWDHRNLNEVFQVENKRTTAENLVQWLADRLKGVLPKGIRLRKVVLWEGLGGSETRAIWRED